MTALEELPGVRQYSEEYIVRAGYFQKNYQEKKENITARVRAYAKIKKLGRSAKWICLHCYPRIIFDSSRMAERHADLLDHTVALTIVGQDSNCLHQCKKCGIISSCQRNPKFHAQTFEIDGPCLLCDFVNKES